MARSSLTRRAFERLGLTVAVIVLLPYAWGPIYRFPAPAPFSGDQVFNPYRTLTGTWQKANLHAHGRAWLGLTSGEQADAEVLRRYQSLGYAVAGVSNYQHISAFDGVETIPIYEHGFNIGKNHQLAIGASTVDWFDFPLWQTLSNRQYVIDRVGRTAALVSLNHPNSRGAYEADTVQSLTGYDLVEVVNGPFLAEDVWDAALSAGRVAWGTANDDTHDVNDPRRMGVAWNMIDAASASEDAIVEALRSGRFYSVVRTGAPGGAAVTGLSTVEVSGHQVKIGRAHV